MAEHWQYRADLREIEIRANDLRRNLDVLLRKLAVCRDPQESSALVAGIHDKSLLLAQLIAAQEYLKGLVHQSEATVFHRQQIQAAAGEALRKLLDIRPGWIEDPAWPSLTALEECLDFIGEPRSPFLRMESRLEIGNVLGRLRRRGEEAHPLWQAAQRSLEKVAGSSNAHLALIYQENDLKKSRRNFVSASDFVSDSESHDRAMQAWRADAAARRGLSLRQLASSPVTFKLCTLMRYWPSSSAKPAIFRPFMSCAQERPTLSFAHALSLAQHSLREAEDAFLQAPPIIDFDMTGPDEKRRPASPAPSSKFDKAGVAERTEEVYGQALAALQTMQAKESARKTQDLEDFRRFARELGQHIAPCIGGSDTVILLELFRERRVQACGYEAAGLGGFHTLVIWRDGTSSGAFLPGMGIFRRTGNFCVKTFAFLIGLACVANNASHINSYRVGSLLEAAGRSRASSSSSSSSSASSAGKPAAQR